MTQMHTAFYKSEIGFLRAIGSDDGLHELEFTDLKSAPHSEVPACLQECFGQLDEYFKGSRDRFTLNLKPQGTDFQQSVWQQLLKIPFGQTTSYLNIATAIDNKKAIRAVGAANGRNRIPIIIPCHRVIGSDGSLIGFGGGIWRKEWLLKHEKVVLV
ncbi:MAG: methylated-DNA--[protein]-cysteine S-methyltransferase [Caldithrix sp.]|nr:MAG: methylated-DNA--[protein]-cysteine S-methyltransferase [Caldithrix sp.]TDI97086.1 MAG: methylated-DNA--[protein]-cysteine S-methyltransferase [Caldithrix sp.]